MDIKRGVYLVVLVFAFTLQPTNADTTAAASKVATDAVKAQDTTPAAPVTAEIRNNTTTTITVTESGGSPAQSLEEKQNFGSQRFPGSDITIQIPANAEARLIKVYGQGSSECGFSVCVMVQ
ncbi:hypothetical protein LOY70_29270 [Pseudomonas sp. B21-054]|uniref:hypothetical protein n=1 Tax=Pseudomonas sp. B21-054 TaxID=2895494 RepID=UPI00222F208E|nr:hypothetical protein [Pseudomonas sp. B21-054]UZE17890.1 hypothetical protein LOY70_29270 [Pseudomonas sp. B21-054]